MSTNISSDIDPTPVVSITDSEPKIVLRNVTSTDGSTLIRIARQTTLDVNSDYIYHLWSADFHSYTALAEVDGVPAGFIMCYPRPEFPDRLFIWQAGILSQFRGMRLAVLLLDHVWDRRFSHVECTVTPSNRASLRFLEKFAEDKLASISVEPFISEEMLGGGHEREDLVTIGPIRA